MSSTFERYHCVDELASTIVPLGQVPQSTLPVLPGAGLPEQVLPRQDGRHTATREDEDHGQTQQRTTGVTAARRCGDG